MKSVGRHTNTHTHTGGCVECVKVAEQLYLHLTFPPFVSVQLSVSSLSVCCVFLASSSPLPLFSLYPFFSQHFFFSTLVSCHCLSTLSHSRHSSPSPSLASFFLPYSYSTLSNSLTRIFLWPLPPSPFSLSYSFFPHHLFLHLSSPFSLLSPSIFFLCDIHNEKSSRRELTHTWPSSVSPAVTDNLSSAERIGHSSLLLFLTFSCTSSIKFLFHLYLCSTFNRDPRSCKETSGKATTTGVKRVQPTDTELNILTYPI